MYTQNVRTSYFQILSLFCPKYTSQETTKYWIFSVPNCKCCFSVSYDPSQNTNLRRNTRLPNHFRRLEHRQKLLITVTIEKCRTWEINLCELVLQLPKYLIGVSDLTLEIQRKMCYLYFARLEIEGERKLSRASEAK